MIYRNVSIIKGKKRLEEEKTREARKIAAEQTTKIVNAQRTKDKESKRANKAIDKITSFNTWRAVMDKIRAKINSWFGNWTLVKYNN